MSKVYFTDLRMNSRDNIISKIKKLYYKVNEDIITENDYVAIKTHFGEYGNTAYLPPVILKTIVDCVSEAKARPFITDTNTLYKGSRSNAIDHIRNAMLNGFNFFSCNAPIIIADGLIGNDYREIEINGKRFNKVRIASAIYDASSVVFITHFKGHELYGFGGAMKNITMGCAPPSMKQLLHSDLKPKVKKSRCTSCGMCIKKCPVGAISFDNDKKAIIDQNICIGCGECTVICNYNAIPINWKTDEKSIFEKTSEYVKAFMKQKNYKTIFFNFLINISPECDCCYWNDVPVVNDIGIIAGIDPVAVDKASVDFFNKAKPLEGSRLSDKKSTDNVKALYNINWEYLFEYAELIGCGTTNYEIIKV